MKPKKPIPSLTAQQMAEVDRLMIEVYHIDLIQMMENAGSHLAELAISLTKKKTDPTFLILCGSGNNGGGGLVAARHLINRSYKIELVMINEQNQLKKIPKKQWSILQKMGVHPVNDPIVEQFDLLIDAMIGYGLHGAPRGNTARWISKINAGQTPILSMDVPSGLEATTGTPLDPCTRATATLTLALPKEGLLKSQAIPYVGELYLADISVPHNLYQTMGLDIGPIFKDRTIIKVC